MLNRIMNNEGSGAGEWTLLSRIIWLKATVLASGAAWNTISGAIVQFVTERAHTLKQVVVGINPVQSGSGDPSPDNVRPISGWTEANVTRTGENLFNIVPDEIQTVSYYLEDNPVIQYRYGFEFLLPAGTYTINAEFKGTPDDTYIYGGVYKKSGLRVNQLNVVTGQTITPRTITIAEDERIIYYDANNSTLESAKTAFGRLNMWVNVGSSASTFTPYNGNTYTIAFPDSAGTVYSGTLTVNEDGSGAIDVTMLGIDMGDLAWSPNGNTGQFYALLPSFGVEYPDGDLFCSMYKKGNAYGATNMSICVRGATTSRAWARDESVAGYTGEQFASYVDGQLFVYELVTPITYQLTQSQVISALQGYNAMWADTGDITVTVRGTPIEEPDAEPLQALNLLLGGSYRNDQTQEDVPDEEALNILLGGADR